MARRPTDPTLDLAGSSTSSASPPRPRRAGAIMVASDPSRPVRTFTLPRLLPTVLSLFTVALIAATVILARGSWKLSGLARQARAPRARDGAGRRQRRALARRKRQRRDARRRLDAGARGDDAGRAHHGQRHRQVRHQSANTGEEVEVALNLSTGEVDAAGYVRLRHMMRCLRTTAETPIDPRLIDLLYRIAQRTRQKLILVSGFRAPMFSLATLSYHTRGMAADIRIPGMTPLMARDLAESMGVHGLGYYPVSGFIHVDVRDDRLALDRLRTEPPGRRRDRARSLPRRGRPQRRGRRRRRPRRRDSLIPWRA